MEQENAQKSSTQSQSLDHRDWPDLAEFCRYVEELDCGYRVAFIRLYRGEKPRIGLRVKEGVLT